MAATTTVVITIHHEGIVVVKGIVVEEIEEKSVKLDFKFDMAEMFQPVIENQNTLGKLYKFSQKLNE